MASTSASGLAYRREGDGPPVVLVHGIPGSARAWDAVLAHLPPGIDVIVPDLLGFGDSTPPASLSVADAGPDAQATALVALLDELGVTGALLVGHDFGGPVSLLVAARRPDLVSAMLVLAANTFPDTPIPFPLSLTTTPVVGSVAARLLFSAPSLRLMLRRGTGPGAPPPDADVHLGPARQRAVVAAIFHGTLANLAELYTPVERALRGLEIPVVVGWGDRDPFFPLEQGRRTADAAGARLREFTGAGHFLPHERPVEVAQEIETLTADVGRSRASGARRHHVPGRTTPDS
jgi:pimeloyl-ACP methyl ester carboxylesterase